MRGPEVPKEGEQWRNVADAEHVFKQIANEIRSDKGLGPALSSRCNCLKYMV
jgi:hypothetical protein